MIRAKLNRNWMRKECLNSIAKQTSCAPTIQEATRQDFLEASIFSWENPSLAIFLHGKNRHRFKSALWRKSASSWSVSFASRSKQRQTDPIKLLSSWQLNFMNSKFTKAVKLQFSSKNGYKFIIQIFKTISQSKIYKHIFRRWSCAWATHNWSMIYWCSLQ